MCVKTMTNVLSTLDARARVRADHLLHECAFAVSPTAQVLCNGCWKDRVGSLFILLDTEGRGSLSRADMHTYFSSTFKVRRSVIMVVIQSTRLSPFYSAFRSPFAHARVFSRYHICLRALIHRWTLPQHETTSHLTASPRHRGIFVGFRFFAVRGLLIALLVQLC